MPYTKDERNRAYEWAANQSFPDKPSRYARIMADAFADSLVEQKKMMVTIENQRHKLEKIRLLCINNNIMDGNLFIGSTKYNKAIFMIFRIITAKIMEIMEG